MNRTPIPAVDRRRAHRRVGAAAVLAFAALLALGFARTAAQAAPTLETAPATTATPTPEQVVPRQVMPFIPGRDRDGRGYPGGRGSDPGGGGFVPAPSTDGTQS